LKKNLDDYLNALTPRQRKIVDDLAEELIAEEMNLQELRKALQHSQQTLADKLNVKQAEISKMERRTDMYVSTLRDYIESMGGKLEITVSLPNLKSIKINQFDLLNIETPQPMQEIAAGKVVKSAKRKYTGTSTAKNSTKPGAKKTTSKAKRRAS